MLESIYVSNGVSFFEAEGFREREEFEDKNNKFHREDKSERGNDNHLRS